MDYITWIRISDSNVPAERPEDNKNVSNTFKVP